MYFPLDFKYPSCLAIPGPLDTSFLYKLMAELNNRLIYYHILFQ